MVGTVAGCSTYGALHQQWSVQTGDKIAATPAVNWGRVFVGSWDGYEYALDEATGSQYWRTFLGVVPNPGGCDELGVTSSPLTLDGTLYLGGGDDYWYSLNMYTGNVLWKVFTGDTTTGHYNWSSPAALNGFAYVGIASQCDTPLVQGQLLRVNMSTHQIVNTWDVVPDGQVGGTIWTKPVVDAARNSVFVTTGNRAYDANRNTQVYGESVVSVDATTLAVKGSWSLPLSDPTPDPDWGTGPTLLRDSSGRDLVSAANKNGVVYAFLRDNVSAGPVWTRRIAFAATSDAPAAGGVYSNGYFDGTRLYYASSGTTIDGATVKGSVRALDPRTGAIIWERPLPNRTFGALTFANGMLVVPSYGTLFLVDPATGDLLYDNALPLYGAATVANGRLFVGDTNGVLHAYTYPSAPGAGSSATASAARVALAQGCQTMRQPAPSGSRVRVTRLGKARAPATIAVFKGGDCTGKAVTRRRLRGGDKALLKVPRWLATGGRISLRSSRAMRLKLALARWDAGQR
jgi:outer membrane protein assembly factor BamB